MHNFSRMVNANQSPEERKLKYWICHQYCGESVADSRRLRSWNWSYIRGQLTINAYRRGMPEEIVAGIAEICQQGYDMFKAEHYANGR